MKSICCYSRGPSPHIKNYKSSCNHGSRDIWCPLLASVRKKVPMLLSKSEHQSHSNLQGQNLSKKHSASWSDARNGSSDWTVLFASDNIYRDHQTDMYFSCLVGFVFFFINSFLVTQDLIMAWLSFKPWTDSIGQGMQILSFMALTIWWDK